MIVNVSSRPGEIPVYGVADAYRSHHFPAAPPASSREADHGRSEPDVQNAGNGRFVWPAIFLLHIPVPRSAGSPGKTFHSSK
jgi:hypothetical protein